MTDRPAQEQFCPHGIRDGAANCIACEDPTELPTSHCDVIGGCPELRRASQEIERLRVAGRELADSSQAHVNTQREMIEALEIEVAYLRAALVRIANVEERPAMIASQALGLVQSDETPKRAYYETHEPPHCPTCECGRTP